MRAYLAGMDQERTRIVTDHDLTYAVLKIIDNSRRYVVLASAYLASWAHLTRAIESAVARGVDVRLVTRTPDGWKRDRKKAEEAVEEFRRLGVTIDQVDRLHAKLYLNELEVVVTSFNLVGASHESVELGVHTTDPEMRRQCLAFLARHVPALLEVENGKPRRKSGEAAADGYCIGCGTMQTFDPVSLCVSVATANRTRAPCSTVCRGGSATPAETRIRRHS